MMISRVKHKRQRRRGFSLVELAIVLGIVGLIIGGIWNVAGQATSKGQQTKLSSQLLTLATNIRSVYAGKAYVDTTYAPTMMTTLTSMKVFGGVIDAPFGNFTNPASSGSPYTSIYACGWRALGSTACDFNAGAAASNVPLFAIEVLVPAGSACIAAVLENSNPSFLPGLVDIAVNGFTAIGGQTSPQSLPLKLPWVTASGRCNAASNAGVSPAAVVDFVFRLVP